MLERLDKLLQAWCPCVDCAALLACNCIPITTWRLPHCLQGEVAYLLATDVAARGLDILGVETVINFDCPTQLSSYLHRWGDSGAGGAGVCSATGMTVAVHAWCFLWGCCIPHCMLKASLCRAVQ